MNRPDDDAPQKHLWAAETAPLPRMVQLRHPPRPDIARARAVVMRLETQADVARVFDRDATVFVHMPDPPRVGATVECVLVHPEDHSELKVMAEVVRVGEAPAGAGVELRFAPPGPDQREALIDFVRAR